MAIIGYITDNEYSDYAAARGYIISGDPIVQLQLALDWLELQPFQGEKTDPLQALEWPRDGFNPRAPGGARPIDANQMKSLDGNSLIKSACDKLSQLGVENFIHWSDEISVDFAGESHGVMIYYVAGGVRFVHPDRTEYNE